ncbi:sigma-70 family RNA polymerase sigma factor [Fimbriiglobus ruber]|uniref:High-affnity carbon uptake protein Hat/HatR n=1 Tax=Fimbriiglobus ruber TaxID=1908690 RepID=A0A225D857_9BACT|nr:sigma-70 family RNA polymerase sigma factor [Fimbriiglobus ruber]OWK37780.1 High-affnity carbon uptake protein Hat/HatR [Fimbriiglobus ruber]
MGHGPDLLTRFFRRLADDRVAAPTTAELLGRFVASHDEEAFRTIVDRHGPMVWGVCSRVLRQPQDIEDAFQATFIVLARRAAGIRSPELLPAWLHGVARRSAIRVIRLSARRREVQVNTMPNPATNLANDLVDLPVILDEELGRLPPKLRQTVVLCHLQSRTYADAAREMGCSIAAVAKRLEQAAARLRDQLTRRGLAPAACTAWALAAWAPEAAAVSSGVTDRAIAAALGAASGATATPVAATVANEILGATSRFKLRLLAVVMALATGAGVTAAYQFTAAPAQPAPQPKQAAPVRVDRFGDPLPDGAVSRLGTVRFRTGLTPCAAGVGFLAGGKTLVSVYVTGLVVFWDAATGQETSRLDGPPGANALTVSADGRRLVVAGKEVWAWDMTPQGPVSLWKKPSPNGETVNAAALSPDGKTLACGSRSTGHLLDAATGELRGPLGVKSPRLVTFAADGQTLVAAGEGPVHVFDPVSGEERRQLAFPEGWVAQLAISPDGTRVAGASGNLIRTWDATTGRELAKVKYEAQIPTSHFYYPASVLFFSQDGRTLIEAGCEHIRHRDPDTGMENRPATKAAHLLQPFFLDYAPIIPAVSPDGKLVALSTGGRLIGMWRTDTGAEIGPSGGPYGEVTAMKFTRNGKELVTAAGLDHFQTWNLASAEPVRRLTMPVPRMGVGSFVVTPTGEVGAVFSRLRSDGSRFGVVEWNAQTSGVGSDQPVVPAELDKSKAWIPTPALTEDGRRIVWGFEKFLIVVDRATGAEVRRIDTKVPVFAVVVSADGETAATHALKEGELAVWDLGTGKERMRLTNRPIKFAAPFALSPDGRWLACVDGEENGPRSVQLWELASRRAGPRFPIGTASILPLTFSPDSRFLAAGEASGTVRVWDLAAETEARQFAGHRGPIHSLAFAPDGQRLASGSGDATALVWDLGPVLGWPAPAVRSWEPTDALWRGLGKDDPGPAARTAWALTAAGDAAVSFLRGKLRPAPAPSADRVGALIEQLGSDRFIDRERAMAELTTLGIVAEPALRAATTQDPETRQRIDRLLGRLATTLSPELLAAVRGIAALERIGTPAAARALKEVAGERGQHPTIAAEAEAAGRRLSARHDGLQRTGS